MTNFAKKFTEKHLYAVAVISVALLILTNQLVLQHLLKERSSDAVVINLAGRQRMLSQKILNLSYQAQNNESNLAILKFEAEQWSVVHESLLNGNEDLNLPGIEVTEIRALFDELTPYVEQVAGITSQIETSSELNKELAEIQTAINEFLPLMDHIVFRLQAESEGQFRRLVALEMLLAIISILILLLEVQFIFRPIMRENVQKARSLQKLNLSKDRILATIVHDLRTPITGIKGLTTLLHEELEEDLTEDQQMMFNLIEDAGNKSLELIRELLDMAMLEGEDVHLDMEATRIGEYLMSTLAHFKNKAKEKGVNLKVSTTGEDLIVSLDPKRFSRVMDNLLSNALKFTDSPGTVEIHTIEKDDNIIIKVSDTGIGIPKDMQRFIFDKFSKARRLGLEGESTTGLGMSIVKQIVELHKGSIWFESEENQGTNFFIRLPKANKTREITV